jgi:hypothetical protein
MVFILYLGIYWQKSKEKLVNNSKLLTRATLNTCLRLHQESTLIMTKASTMEAPRAQPLRTWLSMRTLVILCSSRRLPSLSLWTKTTCILSLRCTAWSKKIKNKCQPTTTYGLSSKSRESESTTLRSSSLYSSLASFKGTIWYLSNSHRHRQSRMLHHRFWTSKVRYLCSMC